jgi:hypothetical protein
MMYCCDGLTVTSLLVEVRCIRYHSYLPIVCNMLKWAVLVLNLLPVGLECHVQESVLGPLFLCNLHITDQSHHRCIWPATSSACGWHASVRNQCIWISRSFRWHSKATWCHSWFDSDTGSSCHRDGPQLQLSHQSTQTPDNLWMSMLPGWTSRASLIAARLDYTANYNNCIACLQI